VPLARRELKALTARTPFWELLLQQLVVVAVERITAKVAAREVDLPQEVQVVVLEREHSRLEHWAQAGKVLQVEIRQIP
jgi:hypothetical protein